MTQALYAHMNNKTIKKILKKRIFRPVQGKSQQNPVKTSWAWQ
jgi:hypothetical protein